jgi:hypothetical protein
VFIYDIEIFYLNETSPRSELWKQKLKVALGALNLAGVLLYLINLGSRNNFLQILLKDIDSYTISMYLSHTSTQLVMLCEGGTGCLMKCCVTMCDTCCYVVSCHIGIAPPLTYINIVLITYY